MTQKFQSSVQHRGDVSYVKLGGVIDEDNGLGELVDKIPTGTAVIDLGEIERINWLSKLESNGTRSVLVECSPAIVAQINLVNNFTGNGVVKSFYVPYFCPECDEEKVLLVESGDMGPPPHEPPTCRCDECDLVMDFDDMPDSYFAFLSNQRKVSESDKMNGTVRELARGSDAPPAKGKVKSRASQPQINQPPTGSKPSVPSLPSIRSTQGSGAHASTGNTGPRLPIRGAKSPSQPPLTGPHRLIPRQPSSPSLAGMSPRIAPPAAQPGKGNTLVFVLVAALVAAIVVLAYLVLKK